MPVAAALGSGPAWPPARATPALSARGLLLHLLVFSTIFLLLLAGLTLILSASGTCSCLADYGVALVAAALAIGVPVQTIVWPSMSFPVGPALAISAVFAIGITMAWSALALRHVKPEGPLDGIGLLFGAMGSRKVLAAIGVLVWPLLGYVAASRVSGLDWNFDLQRLSVAVAWIATFGCVHALMPAGAHTRPALLVVPAVLVLGIYAIALRVERTPSAHASLETALDQYAAINVSLRLLDDAAWRQPEAVAQGTDNPHEFYDYLRANTNIGPGRKVDPVTIDFVRPLVAAATTKPNVFLFVIDSLRRDYLSPYNAAVTFTPSVQRFAAESLVFGNAFTRYGGTGLSVPSIWSGSMFIHKQYVIPFGPMNALQKLLKAEGYRRVMSMDSIMGALDPPAPDLTEIDRGIATVRYDLCRSLIRS